MNLIALPAFADNTLWMLHRGSQAVVVDPHDAAPPCVPMRAARDRLQFRLAAILVTPRHPEPVAALRPIDMPAARRKWKNRIR